MLENRDLTPAVQRLPVVGFGPFTFDRHSRLLRRDGVELSLPPRVLGVLDLLVERAGDIVPRQDLIDSVWKEAFVTDTSLAEAISFLRQALGDDPQAPTYIQTVHRRGYRFVAPVLPIAPPAAAAVGPLVVNPEPAGDVARVSPSIGGELVPWSIAVLCAILAAAALWQYTRRSTPVPPIVRLRVEAAPGTSFDRRAPALALSADGTAVAWSGCDAAACRLYVRSVDQLEGKALAGTEDASAPFFSPDGRWIGFFAQGKIKKVALAGGLPIAVTDAPQPFGAAWLADGRIVFAASAHGGLFRIADRGGDPEALTMPDETAGEIRHAWPSAIPGGRALLFTIATSPLDGAAGRIAVLPLDAGRWRTVVESAGAARPVTADYIAFSRGNELHAAPFDRGRLAIAGPEQAVVSGAAPLQFATSENGAVAYALDSGAGAASFEWTPAGGPAPSSGLAALQGAALSPDGQRIAGVADDQTSADIWVGDLLRGAMTRITHGGVNVAPVWSADGSTVFYAASRGGRFELWKRDAAAAAAATSMSAAAGSARHVFPTSASRDGALLAYEEIGGPTRGDIAVLPLGGGAAEPVVHTAFDEVRGMLSPDGRLIAYQSDEPGRWEVFLIRVADKHRTGISTGGGSDPFWSPDGQVLFYRAGDRLMSVPVDATGERIGAPAASLVLAGAAVTGIAADSRILLRRDGAAPPIHAVLTLEWVRELRRMLGPATATLPR